MRSRWIVIISTAVVSLVAIQRIFFAGDERSEALQGGGREVREAKDASGLRALEQQVAALRSQVALLDHRSGAQAATDEVPASGDRPEPRELTRAELRTAALEEHRRAIARLDAQVTTGPRDPAWTSELRAELTGSLEPGVGSSLRSVECGAALCRAELSHPDKQSLDRFAETLSNVQHRQFQLFFERDGGGLAITVFVAREGPPLPDVAKGLAARRAEHAPAH